MQVLDKDGTLVFDTSGDFSKSSVVVTEQITRILKELLSTTTITTSAAKVDVSVYGVYKKEEVDKLLENYVSSTNALDIVLAALGTLMANGEVPSNSQIQIMQNSINTLSDNNIDFVKRVNTLDSSVGSHSDSITKLESSVNTINSTNLVQTSDISTLKSTVNDLQKSSTSHDTKIGSLETSIKDVSKDITDIKVQQARDGIEIARISGIDTRLSSIETKVADLSDRIKALEDANIETKVADLLERVKVLEDASNSNA